MYIEQLIAIFGEYYTPENHEDYQNPSAQLRNSQ